MRVQIIRQITRGDVQFEISEWVDRPEKNVDINLITVSLFFFPIMIGIVDSLVRGM